LNFAIQVIALRASSYLFFEIKNLGLSGIIKPPIIDTTPLRHAPNSSQTQSFEIFQKYKHPMTAAKEATHWSIVPTRIYYAFGKSSIRYRKLMEHLPTDAVPKMNIKTYVT